MGKVSTALRLADDRGVVMDLRANNGGHPKLLLKQLLPRGSALYRLRRSSGFGRSGQITLRAATGERLLS